MDKIVIDSGVAVKWFVQETYSAEALRILTEYQAGRLDLLAPDLIYAEIGNIAWKKRRFQGLNATAAQGIVTDFCALSLPLASSTVLLDDAYNLAVAHGRSCYDALYVVLSIREKCLFVTADEKLVNALESAFPNIVRVALWP